MLFRSLLAQAAATAFEQHLVSHSVASLPPDARAVLCAAASLGAPLEEEEVGGAAAFLGSPGLVRAALCTLYDRGMLSFQVGPGHCCQAGSCAQRSAGENLMLGV